MSNKLNLTGQRFGNLTVIEEYPERKRGLVQWVCQCDCGNTTIVPGSYLKNGNTKSCGCMKSIGLVRFNQEVSNETAIPLGTRFGKLVVVEDLGLKPAYPGAPKKRRWYKCQCDCGNITEAKANSLKTGQRTSCGCLNSKGEFKFEQMLKEHNCIYNHDTVLPEFFLETGLRYRFDFIIYNEDMSIKYIVEIDGRQHYTGPDTERWSHSADTLETIQARDNIKNEFCKQKNYKLIRIPYWEIDTFKYEDLERK